jgi:putative methionine-R-sulfoxide reductase with GAF domain
MIILVFGYADFQNAGNIQPSTLITAIVIILSGLLLGKRAPILISVLIAITHSTIVYFQMQGVIKLQSAPAVGFENIVITSIMVLIIGMLFQFVISRLQLAIDESRKNEKELQIANRELEENKASLEHRVQERTKALNASAEVSRRISTILEPNRLVFEVVEQIKTAFNYYHAHIYLKNESTGELIMAGGTGDVGKTLLARGHKISKGKGLVGRAAETNSLILVSDTTQDPNWLPNELLPDTKSEIAIPISLGSEVLGVLDVQQNTVNGLTEEDAELLQAISYQVAVALRNAQTYSQTQQIAERESLINEISRKIQNTATIEQALQVTVKELGTALSAKDSRVVLSLPENQ